MDDVDGVWIARDDDGRYSEALFDSDGHGWLEYGRGSEMYAVSDFRWRRGAAGRIDIEYVETREIEEDGSVTHGRDPEPSSHTVEATGGGDGARPNILLFTPPLRGEPRFERRVLSRPRTADHSE